MIVALIRQRRLKDQMLILGQLEPVGEGMNPTTREWRLVDGRYISDSGNMVEVMKYLDVLSLEEAQNKYPEWVI